MLVKYSIANTAPSNTPADQPNISYKFPDGTEDSGATKFSKALIITKIVNKVLPEKVCISKISLLASLYKLKVIDLAQQLSKLHVGMHWRKLNPTN